MHFPFDFLCSVVTYDIIFSVVRYIIKQCMIKIFRWEGVVDGEGVAVRMLEVGWWGWGSLRDLSKTS